MIVEAVGEVFWIVFRTIFLFAVVILLLIVGFFWIVSISPQEDENTIKTKKRMIPDVEINVKTINGVQTSDTTYIYHVKSE